MTFQEQTNKQTNFRRFDYDTYGYVGYKISRKAFKQFFSSGRAVTEKQWETLLKFSNEDITHLKRIASNLKFQL